jgi:hypothetical protein
MVLSAVKWDYFIHWRDVYAWRVVRAPAHDLELSHVNCAPQFHSFLFISPHTRVHPSLKITLQMFALGSNSPWRKQVR